MSNSIAISPSPEDPVHLDPTEEWKKKSEPCKREFIIRAVATAAIIIVGLSISAVLVVATIRAHKLIPTGIIYDSSIIPPETSKALFYLICTITHTFFLILFSLFPLALFTNYADPKVVRDIVNSLKCLIISKHGLTPTQLDEYTKYGIISTKTANEFTSITKSYGKLIMDLHKVQHLHPFGSPDENKIKQELYDLEMKWLKYRDGTLVKELPNPS